MSKQTAGIPYHEIEIRMLRDDRELGILYLKDALESLNNPEERAGALLSIRAIAEAYGGFAKIAAQAGISRESLYRSLSPKGNPTLKTLIAVMNAVGMRLSAIEAPRKKSVRPKVQRRSVAA